MNGNHTSPDLLLRRLDEELTPDERAAVDAHLGECPQCRRQLDRLRVLSGAIDDYSAGLFESPPEGRRRLLVAGMEERAALGRRPAWWKLAAAGVLLAVGIGWFARSPPEPAGGMLPVAADAFIALPYSDANLSGEGAVVLQVEVPRSAIALAGLPVIDGPAEGHVKAEVLVGADGLARGIRFIN